MTTHVARSQALTKEVEALSTITDKPSLVALSYALRHPESWPKDFVWDYSECETCAIGLALRLWPALDLPDEQKAQETWIAREMAMPLREAIDIFYGLAPTKIVVTRKGWFRSETEEVYDFDVITADDVADAIDSHLSKAG